MRMSGWIILACYGPFSLLSYVASPVMSAVALMLFLSLFTSAWVVRALAYQWTAIFLLVNCYILRLWTWGRVLVQNRFRLLNQPFLFQKITKILHGIEN